MLFFYYLPQNVTGERHDARRRIRDSQGSKLKPKQRMWIGIAISVGTIFVLACALQRSGSGLSVVVK